MKDISIEDVPDWFQRFIIIDRNDYFLINTVTYTCSFLNAFQYQYDINKSDQLLESMSENEIFQFLALKTWSLFSDEMRRLLEEQS